ncbi:MAG: Uncharacterised protein [Flavobacteriia bacterium]|nr:MAG: Uncharacterised protein [Flavobacteriia bacterium]
MGSVHDLHAEQAFDVLQLRGRQLVVEDDQIHSFCLAEITDLLHFPAAEIGFGMGHVKSLLKAADYVCTRRICEKFKFIKIFGALGFLCSALEGADQYGLFRSGNGRGLFG